MLWQQWNRWGGEGEKQGGQPERPAVMGVREEMVRSRVEGRGGEKRWVRNRVCIYFEDRANRMYYGSDRYEM